MDSGQSQIKNELILFIGRDMAAAIIYVHLLGLKEPKLDRKVKIDHWFINQKWARKKNQPIDSEIDQKWLIIGNA